MSKPNIVYVVCSDKGGAADYGPIKVGITSEPEKRLASLQTSSPELLVFAHLERVVPPATARAIEREVHSVLGDMHIRGEWFSAPVSVAVEAIKEANAKLHAVRVLDLHPLALATSFLLA